MTVGTLKLLLLCLWVGTGREATRKSGCSLSKLFWCIVLMIIIEKEGEKKVPSLCARTSQCQEVPGILQDSTHWDHSAAQNTSGACVPNPVIIWGLPGP